MRFYRDQQGPVTDPALYHEALRQILLLPPDGTCVLQYPAVALDPAAKNAAEIQMRASLLRLRQDELREIVYIAATMERAVGAQTAERWFLNRLEALSARQELELLVANCKHCREEFEQIEQPNPHTHREFGTRIFADGHLPSRQGTHDRYLPELIAKIEAGRLPLSRQLG
jgi:hypothetical protein